jgi:hypothetical protein
LIPFWRRENRVSSGAWREEALHDAGLVGIGVPISHLLHRKRRSEVLAKDWIPTGNSDESVVEFEALRFQKDASTRLRSLRRGRRSEAATTLPASTTSFLCIRVDSWLNPTKNKRREGFHLPALAYYLTVPAKKI